MVVVPGLEFLLRAPVIVLGGRGGGTKFYRGGTALKVDPGIFKICVYAAVK